MHRTEKTENFVWHMLPFAALVVWGGLCITNNLWYDEAFSVGLVMQPWAKMVRMTAADVHSPFYYAFLKVFYHLCGGGTHFQSLKFFSLIFMMGYMFLGKYYVRKLFGRQVSIWFMLCSLLMPIMSVQAGNVRMYAMGLFFMTLTGLTAYDIFRGAGGKRWIVFCLASVGTVYCHTFAMIQTVWLYLIFIAALLYSRQFQKLKGVLLSGVVVAAVFSPWLAVTYRQMQLRMAAGNGADNDLAKIGAFMDYCAEWFSAVESPIGVVVFVGMGVAIVLGYLAVDRMRETHNYAPALGMASFGLTVLTGGIVSAFLNNCFLGRYVFPGFGFVMLIYAVGMSGVKSRGVRGCLVAALLCCFLLQYQSELRLEYDNGLEKYEQFVQEQVKEGDVVIGPYMHHIFLSVYHPELRYGVIGYVDNRIPFPSVEPCYDVGEFLGQDGAVWYVAFRGETPERVAEEFEEVLSFHYMYYDFVIYRLGAACRLG